MPATFAYYWFRVRSALRWYARAGTRYDVHSPRLFSFVNEVFLDDRHYHAFDLVRAIRNHWNRKDGRVKLQSLGAPSKTTSKNERSVSSLVATNAIADKEGRLLFRLALWLRASVILEFGTNAGISTLYLHAADTRARIHTVEGNADVAALAQETFALAGASGKLRTYTSLFTDWLDEHWSANLAPDEQLDLFFLDGDHRHQPTLDYVRRIMPGRSDKAVFVIADIHWSEGMEKAWEELKAFPEVTASVDLYHFGLLFFDPAMEGPHIGLLPTAWKPWRMGFWG